MPTESPDLSIGDNLLDFFDPPTQWDKIYKAILLQVNENLAVYHGKPANIKLSQNTYIHTSIPVHEQIKGKTGLYAS